jgi:predicted Rdx family selenoprotein
MSGWSLRPVEESDLARYGSPYDMEEDDDLDYQFEDYEVGWGDRIRSFAGRVLLRVGWVVLAVGLAFGSAGIVAATAHQPSTGTRPELTYGADLLISRKLDAAVRDLARLKDDVDSLGDMARKTLSAMAQINRTDLQAAWDGGWNSVNSIDAGAADLKNRLNCGAWASTLQIELIKTYSPAMVDRYHSVCAAIDSVAPLHAAWQSMVNGSATAIRVVDDIETHDSNAADALKLESAGRYQDALNQLVRADDSLADAATIGQTLALTGDVSTLTTWISRTQAFDDTLRVLWQTILDSKGKVTAQVTAALRAVDSAKALLPRNNDVLQVVLYESAGNLTASGISIETSRGALGNALASLTLGSVVGK